MIKEVLREMKEKNHGDEHYHQMFGTNQLTINDFTSIPGESD